MIIAHLPAGYLISKLLHRRLHWCQIASQKTFIVAGTIGAVAPDLDMIYFHLVDHRQHHHHSFWPHFPILWLVLLGVSVLSWLHKPSRPSVLAIVFSLNGWVHVVLDTVVGDIRWLAPIDDRAFSMAAVPAVYHPWWLNFILHWSFLLELGLVAAAVLVWRLGPNPSIEHTAAGKPAAAEDVQR